MDEFGRISDVTTSDDWKDLVNHHETIRGRSLRQFFKDDPERGSRMQVSAGDLTLDYSKHRVTDQTLSALASVARTAGVEEHRNAMFSGRHINNTEDRAVLHVALRAPKDARLRVDGRDVVVDVHRVLDCMGEVANRIRSGAWTGHSGRRIRTVVNIGIGGSDLGPAMAYSALRDYSSSTVKCRFVSNIDPVDLYEKTHDLDPAETLFVICSKSFNTLETITNADVARRWLLAGVDSGQEAVARHFVAVSTNEEDATNFGIDPANIFRVWDWVGGRYSLDSAIGFTLMVAIGPRAFAEFLDGFRTIDEHFITAPLEANMPVIQGLLNVWYNQFFAPRPTR